MDVSGFFLKLLIILVAARAAAEVFAYLRLPAVLGEVAAGVLIGPSLLNVVRVEPVFYLLAEIGVLLLLFEVGMDTDVAQLAKTGGESSLVAITGVIAPFPAAISLPSIIRERPQHYNNYFKLSVRETVFKRTGRETLFPGTCAYFNTPTGARKSPIAQKHELPTERVTFCKRFIPPS